MTATELGKKYQEFFQKYQKYRQVYRDYKEQKDSKIAHIHLTVKVMLQSYYKPIVREVYQLPYPGMETTEDKKQMGDAICAQLIVILRDMPGNSFGEKMKYILDDDYQSLLPQIEIFTADFPELVDELGGISRFKRRGDVQRLGISYKLEKRKGGSKGVSLGKYVIFAAGGLTSGFGVVLGIGLLILGVAALTATPAGWAILGVAAVVGIGLAIAAVSYKIYQDKKETKLENSLNNAIIELGNIGENTKNAITLDQKHAIINEKRAALEGLRGDMGLINKIIRKMKSEQWVDRKEISKEQGVSASQINQQRARRRSRSAQKRAQTLPTVKPRKVKSPSRKSTGNS